MDTGLTAKIMRFLAEDIRGGGGKPVKAWNYYYQCSSLGKPWPMERIEM